VVEIIVLVLLFGIGTFLIGFGFGRWGLETTIDDQQAQIEALTGDQNIS